MVQPKLQTQELHSGRPPWHTVLVLSFIVLLSVVFLPSFSDLDHTVAVPETFSRRLFPQYLSLEWLIILRAASAAFILGMSVYNVKIAFSDNPVAVLVPYLKQSQLQKGKPIFLRGFFCQAPFTLWAWNLLGLSFALNAYLSHAVLTNRAISPVWLRMGVFLFEMAAPLALMVSAVVKYAIWPQALKAGSGTSVLKTFRALCYHNLNVILAVAEVVLWGGLPVRLMDVSLAALFGSGYVLFAWSIAHLWNPAAGPQYLYFFLDVTLGTTTTLILLILYVVFIIFYTIFCGLHQLVDHVGVDNLPAHVMSLVLVSALVCRIRD